MQRGIRLFKIFGIHISIDPSWFLIFFLITWNLSTTFGQLHSDWTGLLRWGFAATTAILFFGSVLLHELAHSLVAIAQGVKVRSIMLHMFGGVSNIERDPPSPKAEFLITIVGPATSFILGLILTSLSGAADLFNSPFANLQLLSSQLSPVSTILLWLGPLNMILAIFNLIPGFPLDGGRILRSFLWALTNNVKRATRWAANVGQLVAWAMILGGVSMVFGAELPFFGSGIIGGVWLSFIGWFLNGAAQASYQQVVVQDILEDVPVRRMMRKDPPTVPSDLSLDSLVDDHLMGSGERAFPVLDDGHLEGIVTLDDLRKAPRREWGTSTVKQIMTPVSRVKSISPEEDAADALSRLRELEVRQLPVIEDGKLLGLVRRRDILRWLQLQTELGEEKK
ncbi:MAG TPA: site-2 protease family protein [Anaerolineales bacterium]|jgi:Zn-dependent protease/CBS domain-containing protein|nr:site-2 protease family protein [Anaerolineales bacterium]